MHVLRDFTDTALHAARAKYATGMQIRPAPAQPAVARIRRSADATPATLALGPCAVHAMCVMRMLRRPEHALPGH